MLTFNKLMQWAMDEGFIYSYGPSYDDPETMVYSGDLWNLCKAISGDRLDSPTMPRLDDIAEYHNAELRFDDETLTDEQGRIHNTNPTHYGWIPTYKVFDCQIWAQDEVDTGTLWEFAQNLIDDESNADQWYIDFTPLGFKRWSEQGESGFHHRQNDTPENMRKDIESKHGECEIIFAIDDTGQFDTRFSAWYRPNEEEI